MERSKPTAADSWRDGEPITDEMFHELVDVLRAHPDYDVRLSLQISHDDSAVVKTIDTRDAAESTASNFRSLVMFSRPPFEFIDAEQHELLRGNPFYDDSRPDAFEKHDSAEGD